MDKIFLTMLLYEHKIPNNKAAFIAKVKALALKLDVPADWLMFVMDFESGLNPQARNPQSTATGLIQFIESTARDLGTTTDALYQMSNVEQMHYVEKYLVQKRNQFGSFDHIVDLYLAIFYPVAIPKPMSYIFPESVYRVNKLFDLNGDQKISKEELQNKILSRVPASYQDTLKKKA